MKLKSIAFDLDDTLIDTSGLLAPHAAKNAFQILIDAGLELQFEECENLRHEKIKLMSHKDLFQYLSDKYGNETTSLKVPDAIQAFYHPEIPKPLPLLPGALDNLNYLKNKYTLFLVTAGLSEAQFSKIYAAQIQDYFKKIFVVNSIKNEKKLNAFQNILTLEKIQPQELFCIGNSLSSEIKDGCALGATTCYFEFGEDRGINVDQITFQPDFHIQNHHELLTTCNL